MQEGTKSDLWLLVFLLMIVIVGVALYILS